MSHKLKKKAYFRVDPGLAAYLLEYKRGGTEIPEIYDELLGFHQQFPHFDDLGNDTLWKTVMYESEDSARLYRQLVEIYARLKTGDTRVAEHLYVERIDFCEFGNSQPFRVRIVNQFNDNYDHIYVKIADANRIYGLELEHILSPNRINYYVSGATLIEEHIAGLPGDVFIADWLQRDDTNQVRLAKEFVKFSERSFIRLLGDMRSYNYVVDITPDFEEVQYRVRAIDFDQQCYEGSRKHYLPGHFEDNQAVVALCREFINSGAMTQYQNEERSLIDRRVAAARRMDCMRECPCTTEEKTRQLAQELNEFPHPTAFEECRTVADVLETNIRVSLEKGRR